MKLPLDAAEYLMAGGGEDLREDDGEFGNVLLTVQAVSVLCNVESFTRTDATRWAESILASQRKDGSWQEFLACGDPSRQFGVVGCIGHGSKAVTTAF